MSDPAKPTPEQIASAQAAVSAAAVDEAEKEAKKSSTLAVHNAAKKLHESAIQTHRNARDALVRLLNS